MTRLPHLPLLLAAALVAAPGAARATDLRLGAGVSWVDDSSYDAFWENDLFSRLDICLAYTTFATIPFRLDAELGYGYAGYMEGDAEFAAMRTTLDVHDVYVGLRMAIDPPDLEWLRPYVRVQGGLAVGLASFRDSTAVNAFAFDDWDIGGSVYAGGGIELVLPTGAFLDDPPELIDEPLGFGVYVEGGYFHRTALSFSSDPDAGDGHIPLTGFAAGDVDLSGGELRMGFLARL